jgi:hypothetical protein
MRFTSTLSAGLIITGVLLSAAFFLPGQDQNDQPKDLQIKGMPARVAATEYQAHAQAGSVTIGAEFLGHSVPTPEHTFSSEDFIVVEAGVFGPPGAHATLSHNDFSLRIAGKKLPLPTEPFELVMKSLKDPEWQPPEEEKEKASKSSLTTGGGGAQAGAPPPAPPKMPFPLRRAMELQVHRSGMEEGDRPLPQAGLLFFRYGGKPENIKSLELIYSGAAGNATIELQP